MQHNPVSIAIESLQQQWIEQVGTSQPLKVVRWLINFEEQPLLNGFFRLESSPHGACEEFFLALFSAYDTQRGKYAERLMLDMFRMWDEDATVHKADRKWEREKFKMRMGQTIWPDEKSVTDKILVDVLADFKQHFCKDKQRLVLVLLPATVDDMEDYNDWISYLVEILPDGVMLCLADYIGNENFKVACKAMGHNHLTLKCGRFDMRQMASDMVASGADPENPQTVFQECLLAMGNSTSNKDKSSLIKWGDKAVRAARQSGSQSFLATAYLVYAGFMMQFKDKRTIELLDKGQAIAQMAYDNKETEATIVLMQIYGYYSAYYSILSKRKTACGWSLRQADFAAKHEMPQYAITIFRHTAQLAVTADDEIYHLALERGYAVSKSLPADELRATETPLIAYYQMEAMEEAENRVVLQEIDARMKEVFGNGWSEHIPPLRDKRIEVQLTPLK